MATGVTSNSNRISLPRRDALRAVASAALSATLGVTIGGRKAEAASVQSYQLPATPPLGRIRVRGVVLRVHHSSGDAGLVIPVARGGRLRLPGRAEVVVIPTIKESSIELALHDSNTMRLEKVLSFPSEGRLRQATDVSALTGIQITFLGAKDVDVPEIHDPTADCCIDCAWGHACACAVCCNSSDPGDGGCCDSGCCPNCEI